MRLRVGKLIEPISESFPNPLNPIIAHPFITFHHTIPFPLPPSPFFLFPPLILNRKRRLDRSTDRGSIMSLCRRVWICCLDVLAAHLPYENHQPHADERGRQRLDGGSICNEFLYVGKGMKPRCQELRVLVFALPLLKCSISRFDAYSDEIKLEMNQSLFKESSSL